MPTRDTYDVNINASLNATDKLTIYASFKCESSWIQITMLVVVMEVYNPTLASGGKDS